MIHTIRQVFRSTNFLIGFITFVGILLVAIIYPIIIPDDPLGIIGQGTFFPPGNYVNVYDSIGAPQYILHLDDAEVNRIESKLKMDDRLAMQEWLVASGVPEDEIDIFNTEQLLAIWDENFDPKVQIKGMTNAQRNYFIRLNVSLEGLLSLEPAIIAEENQETGALEEKKRVQQADYVNV